MSLERPLRMHSVFVCGVLGLTMLVVGCRVPARTASLPVEPPPSFSIAGGEALTDAWWRALGDAGLSAAVDSGLANNFDLRSAWERLQAAQAVSNRQSALRFPALEASAGAEATAPEEPNRDSPVFQAGLSAAYEVDLWGRIRSSVQAERRRAEASRADYHATALALSAAIARVWVRLAEAQEQVTLVDEQIATNTTVLQLIVNRFGLGQVQAVDILRQRQLVERTREQRTLAEARREVLQHQFAVLTGRAPQTAPPAAPPGIPELAPLPDPGIPLDLVQRRPDVQQAFLLLQAADRDVATAVSSQFPRLSLTASVGASAPTARGLFQDWVRSAAGNILAPLFYGGELRAEVDRTEAVRQERLYAYGQSVLVAFQEVEDVLVLEARQRERIALIDAQRALADQTYEQLRVQYLNGAANYLDVLTALDDVQVLRRDLLAARLTLVEHRIALHLALAGPVDTPLEAGR